MNGLILAELGLTHDQAAALTELHTAINAATTAARRHIIPCQLNPEGWFPGNSPTTARTAIDWCDACPVLNQCRAYADTRPFDTDHSSIVVGGQWWSRGKIINPHPARKRREPRACTQCGQDHRDRHRLCRPCRYQRQKTKEIAA